MSNPLRALGDVGQAIWLDYLHARILDDGELERLIAEDGVTGLTSNPAIFEKAIGDGDAYDARIATALAAGDSEIIDLYEGLAIADIQRAADAFRPVHDARGGRDGFVSLEVSPYLAMDSAATIAEARRLWKAVDRPNLMIKVPGTGPGVSAIRTLIGDGINVNVTLLFAIDAYMAVAYAHLAGLEDFKSAGGDVSRVNGVASFFVSRIDGVIDQKIDQRLAAGDADPGLAKLRGKVAISNAKLAYQHYLDMIETPRWRALAAAGAAPQRLLWASTGTKDPTYSDVLYIDTLIGADTVNTVPPQTLDAFRDHGTVATTLAEGVAEARSLLSEVERLGLDLDGVTRFLSEDGVAKFAGAFDSLLGAVAGKRARLLGSVLNRQSLALPDDLALTVRSRLAHAASDGWSRRIWARDASVWTNTDEARWLGWLDAARGAAVDLTALETLRVEISAAGYGHVVLLGMGGSSLGPEVLAQTFGSAPGFPKLIIVDSTDPAQVARTEASIDPANTLFIVASKSGSTLEPDILHRYFFQVAEKALGEGNAGRRFIAITDPGSKLEAIARRDGFAHVFLGDPTIGGRYSVLSPFGMVPAAAIGLDARAIFDDLQTMVRSCGPSVPPAANPGVALGVVMGEAALAGRDKLTLFTSKGIADIGGWLEQLIAESIGKQGHGIIPIDGEPVGPAKIYGADRIFACLRLDGDADPALDAAAAELAAAGHPVIRIDLAGREKLFQEFFRWEIATAVAGAVVGINPFDQPDVEASKIKTRALTDAYEATGKLALAAASAPDDDDALRTLFAGIRPGDYVGVLAYLDRNEANNNALQAIRRQIRDRFQVATALGFGPRFLHSTGQAYKGGPNTGVFLQITASPEHDIEVPGRGISFGVVEAAQAQGDLDVLIERGRRWLRIDLGADVAGGLERLAVAVDRALS